MRRHYSLTYLISQAFKSLFRNGMMTFTSIAVLLVCLIVMGSFGVLVINLNYNIDKIDSLNNIVVYCDVNCTDSEVDEIGRQIRAKKAVIEDAVEFISKEDALIENRKEKSSYTYVFEEMDARGTNPYPDKYIVSYNDPDAVESLRDEIEDIKGVEKVVCRADLAHTISDLKSGVVLVFTCFLIVLFLSSLFVIVNTIKLAVYSRRQEISIMRYVGATKFFITTPFIFEGIIIGLISSGISYAIVSYIYSSIDGMKIGSLISLMPYSSLYLPILILFVSVGVITGIIGSSISLRKYLKA